MEKQLSYIANRIVIESMMQKENLNTSVDVVHPTLRGASRESSWEQYLNSRDVLLPEHERSGSGGHNIC